MGRSVSEKIFLYQADRIKDVSDRIYRLHGILMFSAWVGTTSMGIIFARYFKNQWSGKQVLGKDLWFVVRYFIYIEEVCSYSINFVCTILESLHFYGYNMVSDNGRVYFNFCKSASMVVNK